MLLIDRLVVVRVAHVQMERVGVVCLETSAVAGDSSACSLPGGH